MELRQQFTVNFDVDQVWSKLADVRLVANCVPGFEMDSVSDDKSEIKGHIRVRIGPMNAAFGGLAKIARDDATHTGSLEGTGVDENNGSRAAVKLTYALAPFDNGRATSATFVAAVTLSGLLAQFGKGALIKEVASQLTAEFARRLETALGATSSHSGTAAPATSEGANEIKPLKLLLAALRAQLTRLFGGAPKA